jgi:hypothetical protein
MKNRNALSFIFRTLTIVGVVCIVGSCAPTFRLYSGPELPKQEIAVLRIDAEVVVKAVDGSSTYFLKTGWGGMKLHLLPGRHVIKVGYSETTSLGTRLMGIYSTDDVVLQFVALVGHVYRVRAKQFGTPYLPRSMTWQVYIEDVTGE